MKTKEILHIIIAIVVVSLIIGFNSLITLNIPGLGVSLFFGAILVIASISAKKFIARMLDAEVEHEIWQWKRYGFKPNQHLKKSIPAGIILPVFLTAFSLGIIKFMGILSYETTALTRRAAKRFGPYSFTEMTEWHNALIGAAGIFASLIISLIAYWFPGTEYLSRMAAFYAFSNIIPFSKLDGTQIYFGSRPLYYVLALITLIFTIYAIVLI